VPAALTLRGSAAHHRPMTILPGLTSTRKDRIPAFLEDIGRHHIRALALFPTCLSREEREKLYSDLETFEDLRIPHVHLRSDCGEGEIDYLIERFGTEAFNIHPRASSHAFGPIPPKHAAKFYVENVDLTPDHEEIAGGDGYRHPEGKRSPEGNGTILGGLCPDFSHLENARLQGREDYVETMAGLFGRFTVGCCHLSAIRVGEPNVWSGEWDHHDFKSFADLDYLSKYRGHMPEKWASLELENSLPEQLEAVSYLDRLLG
jgi:hypothetical protein